MPCSGEDADHGGERRRLHRRDGHVPGDGSPTRPAANQRSGRRRGPTPRRRAVARVATCNPVSTGGYKTATSERPAKSSICGLRGSLLEGRHEHRLRRQDHGSLQFAARDPCTSPEQRGDGLVGEVRSTLDAPSSSVPASERRTVQLHRPTGGARERRRRVYKRGRARGLSPTTAPRTYRRGLVSDGGLIGIDRIRRRGGTADEVTYVASPGADRPRSRRGTAASKPGARLAAARRALNLVWWAVY